MDVSKGLVWAIGGAIAGYLIDPYYWNWVIPLAVLGFVLGLIASVVSGRNGHDEDLAPHRPDAGGKSHLPPSRG